MPAWCFSPRTRAPARRQRCTANFTPVKPATVALIMSTAKSAARSGSSYQRARIGIDEQAEMRIVDLDDLDADVPQQGRSRPERRHAGTHEIFAIGIGLARTLGIPQALAQQSGAAA